MHLCTLTHFPDRTHPPKGSGGGGGAEMFLSASKLNRVTLMGSIHFAVKGPHLGAAMPIYVKVPGGG